MHTAKNNNHRNSWKTRVQKIPKAYSLRAKKRKQEKSHQHSYGYFLEVCQHKCGSFPSSVTLERASTNGSAVLVKFQRDGEWIATKVSCAHASGLVLRAPLTNPMNDRVRKRFVVRARRKWTVTFSRSWKTHHPWTFDTGPGQMLWGVVRGSHFK